MPVLSTLRQETFARNVAAGKTFRHAAIQAGYSQRSASCLGSQLMKQPGIAARVRELKAAQPRAPITRDTVLRQLADQEQSAEHAVIIHDAVGRALGVFIPASMLPEASLGRSLSIVGMA